MAQVTEKIIEVKAKVEGEKTVKELKEQVAELTRQMDSLDNTTEEYQQTVDKLVNVQEELTTAMKVGKSQLSANEGSYNALVNRMAALKKAHKSVTDEFTRNRLSEEIDSINDQLKAMDAANGVYVRNVGNYENAIRAALKTPQQELKALRTELAQLEEGTDEYNAVFTRMADLTHQVTEQQEMLKWSSADLGDILGNLSGVATSLAGGFSAFNALTGLMGGESEEIEKAMLQAQRFIQLIQGMEQFEQLGDKISGLTKGLKGFVTNLFKTNETLETVQESTASVSQAQSLATTTTQSNTVATTAQSAANVAAAGTTTLWAKALGVLKTALISTGIGAIVVALGSLVALLGKGLGNLLKWVNGTKKASEQTDNLKKSVDKLNKSLEVEDSAWTRQEKMMKALGKSYDEIYEAQMNYLKGKLALVQADLAEQKAIAKTIGEKELEKEKYKEFNEKLNELVELEKELQKTISETRYDKHCEDIAKATEAEKERTEAINDEAKAADELYKSLVENFKDEKTKLKEKYEEEKAQLERFGKDTTLLTKKYEADKTVIVLKEEEERKRLREQIIKDIELSFRNPSVEYFTNKLEDAKMKLEDFQEVAKTIKKDDQGFLSAERWSENIKYLSDTYNVAIHNMEHFELVFKKVILDYEDAQKALTDYQVQLEKNSSDKKIAEVERLYEMESVQTDNYITQMKLRWEVEDKIFQLKKDNLLKEIELRKAASEDTSELERQLQLETTEFTISQNERKRESFENYKTAIEDSLGGISSILDNVASAWETSIENQINSGKISKEEGERQLEEMKDLQSAIALINALSSAVAAYNSVVATPFIGVPLAIAAAAAALASGLAQVKAIQSVKKGDSSGGNTTRYAEVTPTTPDYSPTAVTNVTSSQETENLANAMSKSNLWVSVKDIDDTQSMVRTREKESTF